VEKFGAVKIVMGERVYQQLTLEGTRDTVNIPGYTLEGSYQTLFALFPSKDAMKNEGDLAVSLIDREGNGVLLFCEFDWPVEEDGIIHAIKLCQGKTASPYLVISHPSYLEEAFCEERRGNRFFKKAVVNVDALEASGADPLDLIGLKPWLVIKLNSRQERILILNDLGIPDILDNPTQYISIIVPRASLSILGNISHRSF
jgi:hypothetical protein